MAKFSHAAGSVQPELSDFLFGMLRGTEEGASRWSEDASFRRPEGMRSYGGVKNSMSTRRLQVLPGPFPRHPAAISQSLASWLARCSLSLPRAMEI